MAASTRIVIPPTSLIGAPTVAGARYIELAIQQLTVAKAISDSVTGQGVTPANLDTAVEAGNPGAGFGAIYYPALSNLIAALNAVGVSVAAANLYQG